MDNVSHRAVRTSNLVWSGKRWEAPRNVNSDSLLIYVTRGALHCEADDNIWIAPPNVILWLPSGIIHNAYAYGKYESYTVRVDPDVSLPNECCITSVTPLLSSLLIRASIFSENCTADSHEGRILDVIKGEIKLLSWENLRLPIPQNVRLQPITEALLSDPANKSSSADWATRFGLSERTMSRLFINDIGMSFGRWRQQLHVTLALQRLTSGSSVQTVAFELGYESASGFISMFKRILGKPPGQYLEERISGNQAAK